jgi:hypothetical protein
VQPRRELDDLACFYRTSLYRIANDQIVEHEGEMDTLGLLQQLGLMPAPGQPIPSGEIVPAGRILSPRMTSPDHRSPKLHVRVSGNGKGVFLVVARLRLLVKPTFSANSLLV